MGLRNWLKKELRVAGHVLTASLHDRVDGMEAMLHRVQQQNNDLTNQQRAVSSDLLEQNTHIANTQTALLQATIHLIEAMRKSQADIANAEARILAMVRDHAATKADVRRFYGEILELTREVQETLDANLDILNCVQGTISARFDAETSRETTAAPLPRHSGA